MPTILDPISEDSVNYSIDKNIDIHNLHEEWRIQPGLVGDYNKLLAQAENERDNIKRKIEVCKANVDESKAKLELGIRKDPKTYDPTAPDKITEGWVSSNLILQLKKDPDYVKAIAELSQVQEDLIKANYKVGVYTAGVKAMESRKSALENEVNLWSREYFAVPHLPKPLIENYREMRYGQADDKSDMLRQAGQTQQTEQDTIIRRSRRG